MIEGIYPVIGRDNTGSSRYESYILPKTINPVKTEPPVVLWTPDGYKEDAERLVEGIERVTKI